MGTKELYRVVILRADALDPGKIAVEASGVTAGNATRCISRRCRTCPRKSA